MGATLDTASNSLTNDNRQRFRFESENAVGKTNGVGNILKHNTNKGVNFKAHEMGTESSAHLKEINDWEAKNQQQQSSSFGKSTHSRQVLREEPEKEELAESNSSGKLAKSFLQLLQANESPQDQRQKVIGVFQSNPKLFKDYLRSRELRHLPAPVQHQDQDFQHGFKVVTESLQPLDSFSMHEHQMRSQQPVWFQQQQQLVGGKLQLVPASLVKQQEGGEQVQPAILQQQRHVVGNSIGEAESQKPVHHVLYKST